MKAKSNIGHATRAKVAITHDRALISVCAVALSTPIDSKIVGVKATEVVPEFMGHHDRVPVIPVIVLQWVRKLAIERP
jgi:hypothetical protein